ncbi:MAG: hypothetical protein KBD37_03940 [Burkholderiales bacterium]|nr:hypothetical protein [Burkholderiales bacterium]
MEMKAQHVTGNQFTRYSTVSVTIKGIEYKNNIVVTNDKVLDFVPIEISQITVTDLKSVIDFTPDLIIFGTGDKIIYPNLNLVHTLQQMGIGVEVMPIQALCRTFNFLVSEDRQVAAILLFTT